jgi:hypothetical protein
VGIFPTIAKPSLGNNISGMNMPGQSMDMATNVLSSLGIVLCLNALALIGWRRSASRRRRQEHKLEVMLTSCVSFFESICT